MIIAQLNSIANVFVCYLTYSYLLGCGGVLTDLKGVFSSPDYPQPYPNNRVCNWTINGRAGDKVRLRLIDFMFESGEGEDCR